MTSSLRSLVPLIRSGWDGVPVLVVGDVMLDQYVWGEVSRISPEAPVPVVRVGHRDQKPGGAANVAMNLAALGARVTVAGFAGGDRDQHDLENLLAEQGIAPLLTSVPQSPTTTKLRVMSGYQQMMRLDTESTTAFTNTEYERLLESVLPLGHGHHVLVLSDYAKGVLSEQVCCTLIADAGRHGVPVLVDPKAQCFDRYRGATALCPNLKELSAAVGNGHADLNEVLDAGQVLTRQLGLTFMCVTMGANGIAVLRQDSRVHVPAEVRQVYDVSGAGDTVAAVMALAIAHRVPLELAAQLANLAAGIVVGKVGTVPVRREELLGAMAEALSPGMEEKVLDLNALLQQLAAWRSSGARIVFTNGCFDLLHIGHIRLLEEARHKGDRLVVAINSDESVRQLKGPMRPLVGQGERARVLAALGAVDAVIVFDEGTPLRLIEAVRPDVLVKGGDYIEETVVGARQVRGWGGRVELVPLLEGISTSRLIAAASAPQLPAKGFSA